MRRVAFISDLHSNLEALDAVLRVLGEGELYCLGDIVGYGSNPNEVIQRLRDVEAVSLLGNHDEAVLTGDTSWFNSLAAIAVGWTADQLTEESRSYLRALPLQIRAEFGGVQTFLTHGSPDDNLHEYVEPETHADSFGRYLKKLGVKTLGLGHTHRPFVWKGEPGLVFNPGSVGQPRDGDPRACFAVGHFEDGKVQLKLDRVDYDRKAASSKIVKAGLPESLASRLFQGR